MTAQFTTLGNLVGDVQYRYAAAGLTSRHSAARIKQLLNISHRTAREHVAMASDGSFLDATDPANLPTTATVSGEVYSEVDWPVNAVGVYGVRVKTAQRWYPLKRVPFGAYQDYQLSSYLEQIIGAPGPAGYTSRLIPDSDDSTLTQENAGKVMIFPVPSGGVYRLWYLKAWVERTGDTDVMPGHSTMTEFEVWDTMIKMLSPDANSRGLYTIWDKERQSCLEMMRARAVSQNSGDAMEPRDARYDGQDWDQGGELVV